MNDDEILRQVEERRGDADFMGRLHRIIEDDREALDRLAQNDGPVRGRSRRRGITRASIAEARATNEERSDG